MNCPICDSEPTEKYSPFCSSRCQRIDLYNWLAGRYKFPFEDDEASLPTQEPPTESLVPRF